jgi:predicted metal-dependent hydrolase
MDAEKKQPLIVGFVGDLMFATRVEDVAKRLGFDVIWIARARDLAPDAAPVPDQRPGELLEGLGGALFDKITRWQPVLLIFDLQNDAIPWQRWIASLKSSPATRRIPILCYGPHVDEALLAAARAAGANVVVPRSRFSRNLPALLVEIAQEADTRARDETCAQPLAPLAREGVALFNEGHYYKCHDALEEAWVADSSPGRDLYQGMLQVGIAYYQIERGNYRGALKMLLRVRQWLDPLPAICRGVNVARLREDVNNVQEALTTLGPDRMEDLDRALFRPIELIGD